MTPCEFLDTAAGEWLRGILLWRWPRRWRCHGNVWCYQHCDRPNDNQPSKK